MPIFIWIHWLERPTISLWSWENSTPTSVTMDSHQCPEKLTSILLTLRLGKVKVTKVVGDNDIQDLSKAPVWKERGRWFASRQRHIFSFWIFCLFPIPDSSVKPIQMKSRMTFIQSNRCIEVDIILSKMSQEVVYIALTLVLTFIILCQRTTVTLLCSNVSVINHDENVAQTMGLRDVLSHVQTIVIRVVKRKRRSPGGSHH